MDSELIDAPATDPANDSFPGKMMAWLRRVMTGVDLLNGDLVLTLGDRLGKKKLAIRNAIGQTVLTIDSLGRIRPQQQLPFAQVVRTTDQVVGTGGWSTLSFDRLELGYGDVWTSANPTRLVASELGLWVPWVGVYSTVTAGTQKSLRFVHSDGTIRAEVDAAPLAYMGQQAMVPEVMLAGEYITAQFFQNTGGNLTIQGGQKYSIRASMIKLAQYIRLITVLELGDSITEGYKTSNPVATWVLGGYRGKLWEKGKANGVFIRSVGTLSNNPLAGMRWPDHEGHSGWGLSNLSGLFPGLAVQATPDVVLIHAGSNDIKNDIDLPNFPNRYNTLVTKVAQEYPNATLICATIGPYASPWGGGSVDMSVYQPTANQFIRSLPRTHPYGPRIKIADMAGTNVTLAGVEDGLHLNDLGYQGMADSFWATMQPFIPS